MSRWDRLHMMMVPRAAAPLLTEYHRGGPLGFLRIVYCPIEVLSDVAMGSAALRIGYHATSALEKNIEYALIEECTPF